MRSISSQHRYIALILVLFFVGALNTAYAQTKTPDAPSAYPIIKSDMPKSASDDISCHYFMWSKFYTDAQRVGFTYIGKSGTTDDNPRLTNIVIVIEESATVPTAKEVGRDSNMNTKWELHMDQATYDSEKSCLGSVVVKK